MEPPASLKRIQSSSFWVKGNAVVPYPQKKRLPAWTLWAHHLMGLHGNNRHHWSHSHTHTHTHQDSFVHFTLKESSLFYLPLSVCEVEYTYVRVKRVSVGCICLKRTRCAGAIQTRNTCRQAVSQSPPASCTHSWGEHRASVHAICALFYTSHKWSWKH